MEDKRGKIKEIIKKLVIIFWVFTIGSVFGFIVEMLYGTILTGSLVIRKGLIYGPFVQVYGMGAVAYYLLVSKVKNSGEAFFGGMFMGGILEYVCSFFQEILFGTISWDYSNMPLNFNGRTSVLYCVYWGIIGILFLKLIYPNLKKLEKYIHNKWVKVLTVILIIFMTYDISISCMAAGRQMERHNGINPRNKIESYLDEKYPDEVVDKVYNNKREVKN